MRLRGNGQGNKQRQGSRLRNRKFDFDFEALGRPIAAMDGAAAGFFATVHLPGIHSKNFAL
jgi:hypothetical protein